MLGWEFPPFISGGLGTACYGLTKAMDRLGIEVLFVLPKGFEACSPGNVKILSSRYIQQGQSPEGFKKLKFRSIATTLRPYIDFESHRYPSLHSKKQKSHLGFKSPGTGEMYAVDMYGEVSNYANKAAQIAEMEDFDIVHAHDWMTYPAGIAASHVSGKPLVVHVHSTEFDRSGEHINQRIYDIEREGMHAASKVLAVSNYTKNLIVQHYGVSPEKVEVVHNGVEIDESSSPRCSAEKQDKIVLFLGRITMQKGPEYFIAAAKKVLEVISNVKFIMAGNGDMMHRMIDLAARLGIGHKILFSGFLTGDEVRKAYRMADLYVMPSVSEPFGIAPLEAMRQNVPVIISKQSGLAETVCHALKVDFWDINEMANKMISVLKRPALQTTLSRNGFYESHKFRWEDTAIRVRKIYEETLSRS